MRKKMPWMVSATEKRLVPLYRRRKFRPPSRKRATLAGSKQAAGPVNRSSRDQCPVRHSQWAAIHCGGRRERRRADLMRVALAALDSRLTAQALGGAEDISGIHQLKVIGCRGARQGLWCGWTAQLSEQARLSKTFCRVQGPWNYWESLGNGESRTRSRCQPGPIADSHTAWKSDMACVRSAGRGGRTRAVSR